MMNLPSILVTCPDYDLVTRYLSAWAQIFISESSSKGHEVYTLKEKQVNRKKFEGMVNKMKPNLLFINGHGNSDEVAGQAHEVILDPKNAPLLKDIIVYAVSCKSAQSLGRVAVTSGATGYVGYREDFILVSNSKTRRPTEDATAALFLDPSNHIIRSLSKGHSAKEAAEKGRHEFTKSIRKALKSDVQSDDDKYVPFLLWNRTWLTSHD